MSEKVVKKAQKWGPPFRFRYHFGFQIGTKMGHLPFEKPSKNRDFKKTTFSMQFGVLGWKKLKITLILG